MIINEASALYHYLSDTPEEQWDFSQVTPNLLQTFSSLHPTNADYVMYGYNISNKRLAVYLAFIEVNRRLGREWEARHDSRGV